MQITGNSAATRLGPSEWFTGAVYLDAITTPSDNTSLSASMVRFAPGARTAWHTHPRGQTIYITEGIGRCQQRGGSVVEIRPGDSIFFAPGEEHWHGAAPDHFMAHVAMAVTDETGAVVVWGAHVTDEAYGQEPA
ncbi:MAG: cupin domain-containing protein [Thermomicrobiales bacterium]|nr:cupin domain-containing protein [Thermomicrobiales bacterium]